MKKLALLGAAASLLSGCTATRTANFAPPNFNLSAPAGQQTLAGAIALTEQFIQEYRSHGSSLSNGRQFFDVPAFIAGAGGATAAALGASPDVAIGTGAFAAITNGAKGYYKPNERADVYYDAVDALACVQQAALGMPEFAKVKQGDSSVAPQFMGLQFVNDPDLPSIREYRAYIAVKNAALKIENTARGRLSSIGTVPDLAGIISTIKANEKALADVKKKVDDAANGQGIAARSFTAFEELKIEELIVKLDACTTRATVAG